MIFMTSNLGAAEMENMLRPKLGFGTAEGGVANCVRRDSTRPAQPVMERAGLAWEHGASLRRSS